MAQALRINGNLRVPTVVGKTSSKLTAREIEVLALIASGKSTKEVAAQLGVSFKTASCHRSRILNKLGVHNAADLTRYAIGVGLVGPLTPSEQPGERPKNSFCKRRQELTRAVESNLRRLATLVHAQADALANADENLWRALEQEIDTLLREKDQGLNELRQHCQQHRC